MKPGGRSTGDTGGRVERLRFVTLRQVRRDEGEAANLPRFQIMRDRDGKHRWRVYNDAGSMIGEHREGFATEDEARRDAEKFQALIAHAPIMGED